MSDLCANSSVPLYCQLASKIQEDIYSGILKPDEQIPPEFDLSEMYQVSRSTVRKAIAKLVSDDLLIKIHGQMVLRRGLLGQGERHHGGHRRKI